MSRKYICIISLANALLLISCGLTDNQNPVPSFIDLKEPVVLLKGGPDLYDTHKITDVWVFADGQILGVFPLPAKVPLEVQDSDVEITILAGIRNNGMNDIPVFYPFYKSIVKTLKPVGNEIYQIPLNFEYSGSALFPINEGFETGNSLTLDLDNKPSTFLTVTSDEASAGIKSGMITLTNEQHFIEIASDAAVRDGQNSRGASYIELDYKGDGEISVGLAKTQGSLILIEYVLFVPCKQNWNKIYIDVTDKLSVKDYDEYRIALGFRRTSTSDTSKIYIDNVKHVHF
ncbi:MAG: hypothetical protein H7X99_01440 [Saprospiraceae bacterium]|nr:hypothetical protein [Saprospiraceae bacterium]